MTVCGTTYTVTSCTRAHHVYGGHDRNTIKMCDSMWLGNVVLWCAHAHTHARAHAHTPSTGLISVFMCSKCLQTARDLRTVFRLLLNFSQSNEKPQIFLRTTRRRRQIRWQFLHNSTNPLNFVQFTRTAHNLFTQITANAKIEPNDAITWQLRFGGKIQRNFRLFF